MTAIDQGFSETQRAVRHALHAHWVMLMVQGVIMVILGVAAFAAPTMAAIAVDIFVGWLFLISGVVALLSVRGVPAFIWTLVSGALSVLVGALLIGKPVEGAFALTLVLTGFFIAEGLFQTVASFRYRDLLHGAWGWMLASGLADLALAAIIIADWPLSAGWVLGLLVGVNLITSGTALVMTAIAGRSIILDAGCGR